MSRRTLVPSNRIIVTEHYLYGGSDESVAYGNAYAPSVYAPSDDRIGAWAAQVYPGPASHLSIRSHASHARHQDAVPRAHVSHAPSSTPYAPSQHLSLHVQVGQVPGSTYGRSQTWESEGLVYAQSSRAPHYYGQVSNPSSIPAEYFLDAKGNYINIATCPTRVLMQLKKEKMEAEAAAEQYALRKAAKEFRKTQNNSHRSNKSVTTQHRAPRAAAPEKQAGQSDFAKFVKAYWEKEKENALLTP